MKSAYRVGETILGVVDVNLPPGHAKVLKVRFCSSLLSPRVRIECLTRTFNDSSLLIHRMRYRIII